MSGVGSSNIVLDNLTQRYVRQNLTLLNTWNNMNQPLLVGIISLRGIYQKILKDFTSVGITSIVNCCHYL